jgi:hypothetical protein
MDTRDRLRDRNRLQACKKVLDEGFPSGPAGARRTMHAVEELADRDDADRARLVSGHRFEGRGILLPLPLDEQVGVDQDGQLPSGGSTSLLSALTSSAKASSTGGALASSSRNRWGGSRETFGGPITATGAPPRVISTCSPAATRFSNSENERAASVAVTRVILQEAIG